MSFEVRNITETNMALKYSVTFWTPRCSLSFVATVPRSISENQTRGEVKVNDSVRKGLGTDAYIFISDIIGLHKELKTRGANIVEGPVERPYDRIEITVVDDDGYQIVFGE